MAFKAFYHDGRLYCSQCAPCRDLPGDDVELRTPANCKECRAPLETELTGDASAYIYDRVFEILRQGPDYWNLISWFPAVPERYRTSTVLALVDVIVDDWAVDRLPILADALMDADYDDEAFLGFLRAGSHEGLVDLCSLARAIRGDGMGRDHYLYKRRVEVVRDWLSMLDGYMYPGDDDGFGRMVQELTAPGADVKALMGKYRSDPDCRTNYLDWEELHRDWTEMKV